MSYTVPSKELILFNSQISSMSASKDEFVFVLTLMWVHFKRTNHNASISYWIDIQAENLPTKEKSKRVWELFF